MKSTSVFASQVSTDAMTIAAEDLEAGRLTIELSFLEMIYAKPEKRGSAFLRTACYYSNLDVFKEAGVAFKPPVKEYDYNFEG